MAETREYGGYTYERAADGTWKRVGQAQAVQQGQVITLPSDPAEMARLSLAQQQAAQQQRDRESDNVRADKSETRQTAATNAQLYTQGLVIGPDGVTPVPIPNWKPPAGAAPALTAKERADAIQAFKDAEALDRLALGMHGKFGASIGQTSGLAGLQDYLPTAENQALDQQAQRARGYVKRSLGFTGGESNTVAESSATYDPYLPSSWDKDQNAANKIAALEQLARDARARSVAILGGAPDANGRITPIPEGQDPSVWTANRLVGPASASAAGVGAQTAAGEAIPPAMQAEHDAWLKQNLGQFDPAAYAEFRTGLDQKYGYPADYQRHLDWGTSTAEKLRAGGATVGSQIPAPDRQLSGTERFRNDMAANPVGTGAINFADAGSMGMVSLLAGDKVQAGNEMNPNAALGGQILGSIGGATMLGKGAELALKSAIPQVGQRLAGGGAGGAFARSMATDGAYSGLYGGNTGQDPLTSAVSGMVGSTIGQGLGKVAGATIGGVRSAAPAAVSFLREKGVPLTVGQSLGGMAKKAEDAMTSLPFVGDMVAARRLEGFQGFNQAAFNEAGAPINATVQNIGEQGVYDLIGDPSNPFDGGAAGKAYDAATAGVSVPLDGQFMVDMQQVAGRSRMLPPDLQTNFTAAMDNRVGPIATTGQMTGEQYQQAMRGLKGYRAEMTRPGFESDYRDSLSGAMDALTGTMTRNGGDSVVSGLAKADTAYRGTKTLQSAIKAAKNGTGSGEIQVFTPAQLNTASTQAAAKYGGRRQFGELIDAGQQVLPSSIPDSGTGRRLIQAGVGTSILGGAGGYDYTNGDVSATSKALALTGLLAAGGTRTGQRALTALLMERPDLAQKIGSAVSKNKGLFGRAMLPSAIQMGN